MRNTIYLEPDMVPSVLKQGYTGRKFKAVICESVTIPMDAGLWSGGSRDQYSVITLDDGMHLLPGQTNAPWDKTRTERKIELSAAVVVREHSTFCGKDAGLTFYVHPDAATKLLPPPSEALTPHEIIVLGATASYKSSYGGRDRYQMAQADYRYSKLAEGGISFMSRTDWEAAKQSLIAKGMLNKAGAITTKGRNANKR